MVVMVDDNCMWLMFCNNIGFFLGGGLFLFIYLFIYLSIYLFIYLFILPNKLKPYVH